MYRNLDLQLIRTFAVVAEHGSMTTAGNVLSQTQGAVSQQIKRLEDAFGCVLFVRDRRTLRLTAPGERLRGHARKLIELNDEVWNDMVHTTAVGRVRLGVPNDLIGPCVAPILRRYAAEHPQIEIGLMCAASPDLLDALTSGALDIAIAEEPVGVSTGECLCIERLVWVGAANGRAHLKQPLPLSVVAETCAFRSALLEALVENKREWRAVFDSGSLEATTATVRADLAVSAWLAGTVPADLRILSATDGLPALPAFAINLHLPAHPLTPALQVLAQHIREGLIRNWPNHAERRRSAPRDLSNAGILEA